MTLRESAAAKVNLTLEVRGKRPDGYHELQSVVMFASFGDELSFTPAAPATEPSALRAATEAASDASGVTLHTEGPFAEACAQGGDANLVDVAANAYARHTGRQINGVFILTKRIPVAAGLGGGSADAAAALRLLARAQSDAIAPSQQPNETDLAALIPLAREIGADVPVCLFSRAAMMTGVGERLSHLAPISPLPAVLVNPNLPLSSRDVFGDLQAPPLSASEETPVPPNFTGFD
ncbi:MAG: hypothetical protein P8Y47_08515, partial [Alphaproteobacteria bacterium]